MNDSAQQALLDQFRGVHTPDVSPVPAAGWWLLFLGILIGLYLACRWYRRYRSLRWQREARLELARLRAQLGQQSTKQTLADSSRLARRVLLASNVREEIASLHGQPWLEALDEICNRPLFAGGFGRLLETAPYQRDPQVSVQDLGSLLDAVDELISAAGRTNLSSS